jgi:hypothetical protein
MIKNILIASVLVLSISCGNSKRAQKKAMKEILPIVLTNDFSSYARISAETQILNASISDSTLTLKVSYNGGCEAHGFELIGSKMIQKSFPPMRGIMLIHNSNNDDCRELVEQELRFNVSEFKYPGSSIMLNLKGWKPKLELK